MYSQINVLDESTGTTEENSLNMVEISEIELSQDACSVIDYSNNRNNAMSQNIPTWSEQSMEVIPGTDSSMISLLNLDNTLPSLGSANSKKRKLTKSPDSYNNQFPILNSCSGQILDDRDFFDDSHYTPALQTSRRPSGSYSETTVPTSIVENRMQGVLNDVIIMEAANEHQDISGLFSNNIKFAITLDNSPFGKISGMSVAKNFTKKIIVIKFPKVNTDAMQELLKINKFGDYLVKCRRPISQQFSRGVVGPIGLETSDQELTEYLCRKHPSIQKVQRLKKGSQKLPTLHVLITFNSTELPEHIVIGYQQFQVRRYIPNPWQCFKCQRFGHSAADCKAKARCMLCAGQHLSNDCPQKEEGRVPNAVLKCANCQGNHSSNFGGCVQIQKAREVEKIRANNNVTYRDALMISNQSNNSVINLNNIRGTKPTTVLTNNNEITRNTKSVGTQTENIKDKPQEPVDNKEIISNLSLLLIKILQCVNGQVINKKIPVITDLISSIMGVDVSGQLAGNYESLTVSDTSQQSYASTFDSHVNAARVKDGKEETNKRKTQSGAKQKTKK